MKNIATDKQFFVYMISVFLIAYPIQCLASFFALQGKPVIFSILVTLTMFAPMFAVLIAKHDLKILGWKFSFKGKIKYYLLAWFLPTIFSLLGGVIFYAIFAYTFDMTGKYLVTQGAEQALSMFSNPKISILVLLLISIFQSLLFAPIFNLLFALGEEIGWRGYMYPYLKNRLGVLKGRIVGGIIWGIWHWPLIILVGYEYGTNYYGFPILGPILFIVFTVTIGIILDYLYVKSESIIVPSIFHGAINGVAVLPLIVFDIEYEKYFILGPSFIGMISMLPILLSAIYISYKEVKH